MRMMGEQFVTGQTIEEALANSRRMEARGFRYSYDMLGEAATTAADAARYLADYESAIHAIGKRRSRARHLRGAGHLDQALGAAPALQPRAARPGHGRTAAAGEGAGRCSRSTTTSASTSMRRRRTGWSSRSTCWKRCALDPELAGWNGIGFVVQAYGKRCPFVLDWLIDLARGGEAPDHGAAGQGRLLGQRDQARPGRRARGFPGLHPQGPHRRLLPRLRPKAARGARRGVSRNSRPTTPRRSRPSPRWRAPNFYPGQYEFQCLHGMGEPLYEEVVGPSKLDRPCRIYAPVGTHETLLAYLVRRLLENGANSSFVNRIADEQVPVEELIADPVEAVRAMPIRRRAARAHRPAARPLRRRARQLGRA